MESAQDSNRCLVPVCGDCSTPKDLVRNENVLAHVMLKNVDGLLGKFIPVRKAFAELDARHSYNLSKEDNKSGGRSGPSFKLET